MKKGATILDHWRAIVQTQRNWIFNVRSCVTRLLLYRLIFSLDLIACTG